MKFDIASFQCAGPIRFGMSQDELYASFGRPNDVNKGDRPRLECYYSNITVHLNKELGTVNEITFFSDPSNELFLGGANLDWDGRFVPALCDLDGDAREAMGFISLFNLGLLLVDFFDEDSEPGISVVSREVMSAMKKDPVLDSIALKKKMKKFGIKPR
jgi:hypothetical protein